MQGSTTDTHSQPRSLTSMEMYPSEHSMSCSFTWHHVFKVYLYCSTAQHFISLFVTEQYSMVYTTLCLFYLAADGYLTSFPSPGYYE